MGHGFSLVDGVEGAVFTHVFKRLKKKRFIGLIGRERISHGLKTGCRVEERQFQTRQRIEAFLGVGSVISVMLLRLRDLARGTASMDHGLSVIQLNLLRKIYPDLSKTPNVKAALRAVVRLGGFLARKGDGVPCGVECMSFCLWSMVIFQLKMNSSPIDHP